MIGIFDSGIGGFTIAKQIIKKLPQYQIIYFGDTARVPYGSKSKKIIKKYALQDSKFLLKQGAKIIVIACHTASAVAANTLRRKFSDIPIFDVVKDSLIKASRITKKNRIGIIGTRATIASCAHENYLKKIDKNIKIYTQACPLIVPLVEENWLNRPEAFKIIREYLKPLKKQGIDTLVLACTHYPLVKSIIQKAIGKKIIIIDPAEEIAKEIELFLKKHPVIERRLAKNRANKFFVSDISQQFKELSKKILGKKIKIKQVSVD